MISLGTVPAGSTVYIPFSTYAGSTGASATCTGFAVTDVEIYKNGSTTQRASDAGIALLDTDGIDFDSITGLHGFSIDLSDNTDAGFYAVGSWYWVVVSSITVDSQTVTFLAAVFRIGPAENTAGYPVVDTGKLGGTTQTGRDIGASVLLSSGTGTGQISLSSGAVTVGTNNDKTGYTASTVSDKTGYSLTATTGLGNQTANITGNLSGSVGSVSGAVGSVTGAVGSVTGNVGGNVTGSVGSVVGAVGSVTGNVGGNVTGSVGSVASGGITAASIANGAIGAATFAADVDAEARNWMGLASANLDTQLADLPTVSEFEARTLVAAAYGTAANQTTIASYIDTEVAAILAAVDTEVAAIKAKTDNLPSDPADQSAVEAAIAVVQSHGDSTWATATSVTVSDKTGFKLASDGLDSVATTAPTGPAANFREMVVQVWRRFFKRSTRTYSGGTQQIVTYADNGTTPVTTQTISDDGTTETQGVAS